MQDISKRFRNTWEYSDAAENLYCEECPWYWFHLCQKATGRPSWALKIWERIWRSMLVYTRKNWWDETSIYRCLQSQKRLISSVTLASLLKDKYFPNEPITTAPEIWHCHYKIWVFPFPLFLAWVLNSSFVEMAILCYPFQIRYNHREIILFWRHPYRGKADLLNLNSPEGLAGERHSSFLLYFELWVTSQWLETISDMTYVG